MLNFNYWNYDPDSLINKKRHCCKAFGGGVGSARMKAIMRKLKQLAEKIKRLTEQLSTAKTPTEKNSLMIRIEQTKAEIAILERELNT